MKPDEAKSVIRMIRDASSADLLLVSVLVLVPLLASFTVVLGGFPIDPTPKVWAVVAFVVLYVVLILAVKWVERKKQWDERAKDRIVRLIGKFRQRSFQYIRAKLGDEFTDECLQRLIDNYPRELRQQGIKGKGPGVGLVIEEEDK